jgi:hypothetical protein
MNIPSIKKHPFSVNTAQRAAWATMMQFFMNGAVFGTWGVQIPVLKAHFKVADSTMLIPMLCIAIGAVLSMTHVGRWITAKTTHSAQAMDSWKHGIFNLHLRRRDV